MISWLSPYTADHRCWLTPFAANPFDFTRDDSYRLLAFTYLVAYALLASPHLLVVGWFGGGCPAGAVVLLLFLAIGSVKKWIQRSVPYGRAAEWWCFAVGPGLGPGQGQALAAVSFGPLF